LNNETIFAINIIISLLPILFIGLMFRDQIEGMYTSNLTRVGAMLIVTAGLLVFAQRAKPKERPMTPKSAFIMGIAQAVAVFPGLSRSGATISAGLMAGVKREEVSKFSFLMVLIPVIGMNLLDVIGGDFVGAAVGNTAVAAGFITAFLTGTLACRWMIRLVTRGKLAWFAVYCLIVGLFSVIYSLV
jgi:undecaprenyl-diphosphatase